MMSMKSLMMLCVALMLACTASALNVAAARSTIQQSKVLAQAPRVAAIRMAEDEKPPPPVKDAPPADQPYPMPEIDTSAMADPWAKRVVATTHDNSR